MNSQPPKITPELIDHAYWLLLGRAPESEQVRQGTNFFSDFNDLTHKFMLSAEFRHAVRPYAISQNCRSEMKVTTDYGFDIFVSLDDIGPSFQMTEGGYERETTEWILNELNPDRDFLDVGANLGWYSLLVGSHLRNNHGSGSVFALECNKRILPLLYRSIAANELFDKVSILPLAAHYEFGYARFMASPRHPGGGGLSDQSDSNWKLSENAETYTVSTAPIDAILSTDADIGLIKMDIEGAELLAMKGLTKIIERCRPTMIMEINAPRLLEVSNTSPTGLLNYISALNYKVYSEDGQSLTSEQIEAELNEKLYNNYVFRPL